MFSVVSITTTNKNRVGIEMVTGCFVLIDQDHSYTHSYFIFLRAEKITKL